LQSAKGGTEYPVKMSAQTKVEVTRGVFDPRTYKQVDKENWARKRKPEWMATTGQIHFVRERTVASQERELEVNQKLFKCVLWSEIYDLSTKLIHTLLSGGAQGSG